MKKTVKSIVSILLILSMLLCATVPALAAGAEEEYISELRLVYADDYNEAKQILADSEFGDYKLLKENLNKDSDEIGVFLAYKTTTDIEEAITDLAIMQMNGGYTEGNYQEMLKKSYEEYLAIGEKYETAIAYFNQAYDADYFLAKMAFRQLNLYTIETVGLEEDEIPDFEGELLGDIFYDGVESAELAQMFMEGNAYVLNNIRSLLAMGVSYNEDGATYLDRVGSIVKDMGNNFVVDVDDEDRYNSLAALIAPTVITLKGMFKELEAYEDELNYEDEEITAEELKYAENKTLANMTRGVIYLNGKTLYDFCMNYTEDKNDYSSLYPLVAALNEGQEVMTELACYYNVIRYSMSDYPEEYMEEEIAKLEEKYGENPFNLYEGVDRTVFKGTFALTTEATRADAYDDENTLADAYFGNLYNTYYTVESMLVGAGGIGFMIWGAIEKKAGEALEGALLEAKNEVVRAAKTFYQEDLAEAVNAVGSKTLMLDPSMTSQQAVDHLLSTYCPQFDVSGMSFGAKFDVLSQSYDDIMLKMTTDDYLQYANVNKYIVGAKEQFKANYNQMIADEVQGVTSMQITTISGVLYIVGGAMLLYSAFRLAYTAYSYYHPSYDDIPLSMVDMRETVYGDRYIKYDVVFEAETNKDGIYEAADLNAFEAKRWNALYYTKSYEAGKPLLADEFVLSNSSNKPKDGYTPVHRFGEVVCYDLNKYNFEGDTNIYLSVKQSKNNKSAVADVPAVVGSMFGAGFLFLAGGVGLALGVGGTVVTQGLVKKKKATPDGEATN